MEKDMKWELVDTDIEERIELKQHEVLYLYDLDLSFGSIVHGKLLLVYENDRGSRVPLKIISKQGFILGGYTYFIEKKAIDNLYFIALDETEILKVSKERSRELLTDRDFLFQCLKNVTTASFTLIEELTYRLSNNIEKFLAYALLHYSEEGELHIENFTLFAEFMKCSRSNFYLALGKLVDRGVVEKEGKTITITDLEGLRKVAEI